LGDRTGRDALGQSCNPFLHLLSSVSGGSERPHCACGAQPNYVGTANYRQLLSDRAVESVFE